jgi:predicted DNA binding protein/putative methionine-R-sulfoxide reductase with GAF domain
MVVTEPLARKALDTLSSQIAVIDSDGMIRFTNTAWGWIAEESVPGSAQDMTGVNYFESVDVDADEHAEEAVGGLRAVLAGEREEVRLEYPCHSDDEKRWFLMRATPFTVDGDRFATVAHIEITDRRLAELAAQDHAEQAERDRRDLEHLLERINGVVQDVTQLLVESVSRPDIESGVCDRLAETDTYTFAWIGDADFPEERLVERASAGRDGIELAAGERELGESAGDPSARALLDREVYVVEREGEDDDHLATVYGPAVRSLIAIPLVTRETSYGVLTICSDQRDAFDEREQVVLEALGRAIANALNAVESMRTLTTDSVVEMTFTVEDEGLFTNRLTAGTDATLALSGTVFGGDGTMQLFLTLQGGDPAVVDDLAADDEDLVEYGRLADNGDGALYQFTLSSSLVGLLVDRGAVTRSLTSEAGRSRVTVEFAQETDARDLFESVTERYDRTSLVGYHEHERSVETRQEFRSDLEERLTDRQATALRIAYYSGFFDWPREVDGDELAGMMDISRSTFHQHLRVAERKVLESFFESP